MPAPGAHVSVHVVSNDLPAVRKAIMAGVARDVEWAGFGIEAAAKVKVPVLTGTLRRSIHTVFSSDCMRATVGPSVLYGKFVELGTRHMAARPYLRPAFELVYPKFLDRLKSTLKRAGA